MGITGTMLLVLVFAEIGGLCMSIGMMGTAEDNPTAEVIGAITAFIFTFLAIYFISRAVDKFKGELMEAYHGEAELVYEGQYRNGEFVATDSTLVFKK